MDAVAALLRAAIRIADASAAVVAFDDEPMPIAFSGCSVGAAASALRDGTGAFVDCATPASPSTLVLIGATVPTGGNPALSAVAAELGAALLEGALRFDAQLSTLAANIENLADPAAVVRIVPGDGDVRIACVNGAFARLFGYTTYDLQDDTDDVLFATVAAETVALVHGRVAAGEPVRGFAIEMRTREDAPIWVELTARTIKDEGGTPRYAVFTLRDITARREFEAEVAAEKQRLTVTLRAIGDAVITTLPDGRVDFINNAAQRLLGLTFADAYGMPLRSIVHLEDDHHARQEIALDPSGEVRGEGGLQNAHVHLAFVSSPIIALSGSTIGFVVVLRDVTEETRLTRRLAYEASHDPLTRLPNRRRFEEMIEAALESARRTKNVHTVAYIDLDRFKLVNDTLGHQAGDRLLRDLARQMSLDVRGNDVLARIGGDEFALLLHECTPANAQRVADKIRESIVQTALELVGGSIALGASIGIAAIDATAVSAAAVLAAADGACYAAKAAGRNAVILADATAES